MNKIIPEQQSGAESNIEEQLEFANEQEAKAHFELCRNRLLNVNHWQELAGNFSATFTLCDDEGNKLNRSAEKNDKFKIDIPPFKSDNKFDWVEIFDVESISNPEAGIELFALHVQPSRDPQNNEEAIKHFFGSNASSSFIVQRKNNIVSVGIFGRNEKPNIEKAATALEAIRNTFVALGAMAGLSSIQWKKLANGIISTKT